MNPVNFGNWHYLGRYFGWQGCDEVSLIYSLRDGIPDMVSFLEPELCTEWGPQ